MNSNTSSTTLSPIRFPKPAPCTKSRRASTGGARPLPFALHHINLWLLRDEIDGQQGWTIVDCGIASDTIKANWERVFDTVLGGLPVLRGIVTHCHPDHLGLAVWLCEGGDRQRWKVRLWMS